MMRKLPNGEGWEATVLDDDMKQYTGTCKSYLGALFNAKQRRKWALDEAKHLAKGLDG